MSTAYHSKLFAIELTRQCSAHESNKLNRSILNATVDLNPHQIDAALFAFRSPLSRGAVLADEVGLGKTIEAGLIVSQLWAERRRRILGILPAGYGATNLVYGFYPASWDIFGGAGVIKAL